jgi:hypothetical protein
LIPRLGYDSILLRDKHILDIAVISGSLVARRDLASLLPRRPMIARAALPGRPRRPCARCSVKTPQAAGSVWRCTCTVPACRFSPSTSESCSACMRPPTPRPAVLLLSFGWCAILAGLGDGSSAGSSGGAARRTPQEIMQQAAQDAAAAILSSAEGGAATGAVALDSYVAFKQLQVASDTLLIELTHQDCGPACVALEEVFAKAAIRVRQSTAVAGSSSVLARADASSQAGRRLVERHGIARFPTMLLFSKQRGRPVATLDVASPLVDWTEQGLASVRTQLNSLQYLNLATYTKVAGRASAGTGRCGRVAGHSGRGASQRQDQGFFSSFLAAGRPKRGRNEGSGRRTNRAAAEHSLRARSADQGSHGCSC